MCFCSCVCCAVQLVFWNTSIHTYAITPAVFQCIAWKLWCWSVITLFWSLQSLGDSEHISFLFFNLWYSGTQHEDTLETSTTLVWMAFYQFKAYFGVDTGTTGDVKRVGGFLSLARLLLVLYLASFWLMIFFWNNDCKNVFSLTTRLNVQYDECMQLLLKTLSCEEDVFLI